MYHRPRAVSSARTFQCARSSVRQSRQNKSKREGAKTRKEKGHAPVGADLCVGSANNWHDVLISVFVRQLRVLYKELGQRGRALGAGYTTSWQFIGIIARSARQNDFDERLYKSPFSGWGSFFIMVRIIGGILRILRIFLDNHWYRS